MIVCLSRVGERGGGKKYVVLQVEYNLLPLLMVAADCPCGVHEGGNGKWELVEVRENEGEQVGWGRGTP